MGYKYLDYPGKSRRPSAKDIGTKLGIAERTVRLRIKKMEQEGFIQYYEVIPNLSIFDLPLACLFSFQVDDIRQKQHALEQLSKADHIIEISDMIGGNFGATFAVSSEKDVEQVTQKLMKLTNTSKVVHSSNRWFTTPKFSLGKLDWKLIKALRYDALRSTHEIATDLEITNRMADYRITRLLESKAVVIRAVISARDRQGIILYNLILFLDPGMKEKIMDIFSKKYKNNIFLVLTPPGPMLALGLFSSSIGEAEDTLLDSLSIPGVKNGNLFFFKNDVAIQRPSWIEKIIEKKILST